MYIDQVTDHTHSNTPTLPHTLFLHLPFQFANHESLIAISESDPRSQVVEAGSLNASSPRLLGRLQLALEYTYSAPCFFSFLFVTAWLMVVASHCCAAAAQDLRRAKLGFERSYAYVLRLRPMQAVVSSTLRRLG